MARSTAEIVYPPTELALLLGIPNPQQIEFQQLLARFSPSTSQFFEPKERTPFSHLA